MSVDVPVNVLIDESRIDFSKTPLVPAIIRDFRTGGVLMLAYMNADSYERSRSSGETWFWSRSRGELWNKGATSGNRQRIRRIQSDCDGDALLIDVDSPGPACHTGATSCFPQGEVTDESSLTSLYALLRERRRLMPPGSYTADLFRRGTNAILQKVGEEATEVILATTSESAERVVEEVADLTFHLLLLLIDRDIEPSAIAEELLSRRGGTRRAD